ESSGSREVGLFRFDRRHMRGVTITDRSAHNNLALDLIDILEILGPRAGNSVWLVEGVESSGHSSDDLHTLSNAGTRVSTARLREIASDLDQIIDRVFSGYGPQESEPWVIIRAVDSSAYDVETDDDDVLSHILAHFREVTQIP